MNDDDNISCKHDISGNVASAEKAENDLVVTSSSSASSLESSGQTKMNNDGNESLTERDTQSTSRVTKLLEASKIQVQTSVQMTNYSASNENKKTSSFSVNDTTKTGHTTLLKQDTKRAMSDMSVQNQNQYRDSNVTSGNSYKNFNPKLSLNPHDQLAKGSIQIQKNPSIDVFVNTPGPSGGTINSSNTNTKNPMQPLQNQQSKSKNNSICSSNSIPNHLAQTLGSLSQSISMSRSSIKPHNQPPLNNSTLLAQSLPPVTAPTQKKKTLVEFNQSAFNNVSTASHTKHTLQRPRSNSDSLTTIKTKKKSYLHKRTLTNSKSNIVPTQVMTSNTTPLRRGKWTVEEEEYVARVIRDFNTGHLNAPAGTTLRTYLSEKLHCDPMRITKKFTGDSCIGKRVYHPVAKCPNNEEEIEKKQVRHERLQIMSLTSIKIILHTNFLLSKKMELAALEKRWRRRLEMQQREITKKNLASLSPPSTLSSPNRFSHTRGQATFPHYIVPTRPNVCNKSILTSNSPSHQGQVQIAQTATWLDRASTILSKSTPDLNVDKQIKEVEKLIHEGPNIKNTLASIPSLLQRNAFRRESPATLSSPSHLMTSTALQKEQAAQKSLNGTSNNKQQLSMPADYSKGTLFPTYAANVPKKRRRSFSTTELTSITSQIKTQTNTKLATSSGKEDAEALVSFLNSVRAESYRASCKNGNHLT